MDNKKELNIERIPANRLHIDRSIYRRKNTLKPFASAERKKIGS